MNEHMYSFGLSVSHGNVWKNIPGLLLSMKKEVLPKNKIMSGLRKRYMFCRSSRKHGDINVQCRILRSSSSHSEARIRFWYLVREMDVIAECELEWR